MTDLSSLLAFDPKSEHWDMQLPRSLLDMRTQAELIVLRYRDHHAPKEMDEHLSRIYDAIHNLPTPKEESL